MVNKPKAIGTKTESAVVSALNANGWPHAERRALKGALDEGDITGTPGVCWSVKGGNMAATASDLDVRRWLAELEKQRVNARADLGVLVMHRRGVGLANAHRWWAVIAADRILRATCLDGIPGSVEFPVRLLLSDACKVLRSLGYGDPLFNVEVAG